jgi:hypothetical protein
MRKAGIAAIAAGAVVVAAGIVVGVGLAVPVHTSSVIDRTSVKNYTLKSTVLASCSVGGEAGSCSVSAQGVTCKSPQLKADEVFYAWPLGVRERYRVRTHSSKLLGSSTVETSGYRYAFHPYGNAIACGTS